MTASRPALASLGLCMAMAFVSACTSSNSANAQPASRLTLIDNVRILDGHGGPARPGRVLIGGERIAMVLPSTTAPPAADKTIDGAGGFLLPGFIDMHAHFCFRGAVWTCRAQRFNRGRLRSGCRPPCWTSESRRSAARRRRRSAASSLRDDLNAGRVRGPRAFASAEFINDPALSEGSCAGSCVMRSLLGPTISRFITPFLPNGHRERDRRGAQDTTSR